MIRRSRPAMLFAGLFIPLTLASGLGNSVQIHAQNGLQKLTIWEARRTVQGSFNTPLRFSAVSIERDLYSKKGMVTYTTDLTDAPKIQAICDHGAAYVRPLTHPKSEKNGSELHAFIHVEWDTPGQEHGLFVDGCPAADRERASAYAQAFNRLVEYASDANEATRAFDQRAAAWRALATKPPIPEDVRVQQLMAEDALKQNQPLAALHYFEKGLELYPTWPEGNFNAALIAGQIGDYSAAVEHIQAYLALVPDAADAQAARDKLLVWKAKASGQ